MAPLPRFLLPGAFLLFLGACPEVERPPADDDDSAEHPADDDDSGDVSGDDDDATPGPCDDQPEPESMTLVEECRVEIAIEKQTNLEVLWQFSEFSEDPCSKHVMMTPLVVPLTDDDGDGAPSPGDQRAILFHTFCNNYSQGGRLRALRGDGTALMWSVVDPAWATQPDSALAAGDIDGDGWPEIVAVSEGGQLMAFDRFGQGLWKSSAYVPPMGERGGAFLADLGADGSVEIVFGNQVYDSQGNLLATGAHGRGSNNARPEFPTSFAADLDLDGVQEVVVGNALYDPSGATIWHNGEPDGFVAVGNFDSDPEGEMVVVSTNTLRVQDTDGTVIAGPVSMPGTGDGGPPTLADFDGDGQPEVGVANLSFYSVFDTDLSVLWSNPTIDESSSVTGSSAFDFDADGVSEIVYSDEHFVYVWEGASGAVLHQGEGHASGTHLEYPVVAQVLGSGPPQIVVGSNNLIGEGWNGITLLVDSGRSWATTGSIWNQHAFMPTHINDDLSIPTDPEMPWLLGQGFRQNQVVTVPGVAAPDLLVEAHAYCPDGDLATLRLRPGNQGYVSGPVELSVGLDGELDSLATVTLAGGLPAAELGRVSEIVLAGLESGARLRVQIDPMNEVDECDETNNEVLVVVP